MIADGHSWDALQTYSLEQVLAFQAASERAARLQRLHAALGARVAQADASGWKKFVRSLGF